MGLLPSKDDFDNLVYKGVLCRCFADVVIELRNVAQLNCPIFGSVEDTLATGGRIDTTTLSQSNQFLFALLLI